MLRICQMPMIADHISPLPALMGLIRMQRRRCPSCRLLFSLNQFQLGLLLPRLSKEEQGPLQT